MWEITCPACGFVGTDRDFDISLCDEIFCPECSWYGMFPEHDDEDYEDDSWE